MCSSMAPPSQKELTSEHRLPQGQTVSQSIRHDQNIDLEKHIYIYVHIYICVCVGSYAYVAFSISKEDRNLATQMLFLPSFGTL